MTKAPKTRHMSIKNQKGVGLVEVLVALIILSVGLLGIASLYVTTLQAKTTSLSRMKAVYLAQDMADRIRANASAAASYNLTSSPSPPLDPPSPECKTNNCSSTEMAAYDKYEWDNLIQDQTNGTALPQLIGRTITVGTASTPTNVTITLTWKEPTSTNCDSSIDNINKCPSYTLSIKI